MGTQLLFIDVLDSLRLLAKKLCGHKVTKRERRKMQRTATDVVTLVPITILMLIPVSPVLMRSVEFWSRRNMVKRARMQYTIFLVRLRRPKTSMTQQP